MPFASNLPPKTIHKKKMVAAYPVLKEGVRLKDLPSITSLTHTQCLCVLESWVAQGFVDYDTDTKKYTMVATPPEP